MPARLDKAFVRIAQTYSASSTNIFRFRAPVTGTISRVKVVVGTGPTGRDALFDVNVAGTSIWAGDPAQRITILDGQTSDDNTGLSAAITEGQEVTVDFDGFSTGSDTIGGPVEITIWMNETGATKTDIQLGLIAVVAAQFDKTDTTLANVTGLTFDVEASKKYRFRAVLHVTADATGGQKIAIAGTCTATVIIYSIGSFDNGSPGSLRITSRQTALAGSAAQAGQTSYVTTIEGVIEVNGAGTLTVQFAQSAANNTSSVLVGSTFEIQEVS